MTGLADGQSNAAAATLTRLTLVGEADCIVDVVGAISSAGGTVLSLSTLRTDLELGLIELELAVHELHPGSLALALKGVSGVQRIARPQGAALLDRRQFRIGGRVRWPASRFGSRRSA